MNRCNYITFGANGLSHDTLPTATKSSKSYLTATVLVVTYKAGKFLKRKLHRWEDLIIFIWEFWRGFKKS
jgi:hypothetical protein